MTQSYFSLTRTLRPPVLPKSELFRLAFIQLNYASHFRLFRQTIMQLLTPSPVQQGKLQHHDCWWWWSSNSYTWSESCSTSTLQQHAHNVCNKKNDKPLCLTNTGTNNVYIMHSLCSSRGKYTETCGHEQRKKQSILRFTPNAGRTSSVYLQCDKALWWCRWHRLVNG